MLKPTVWPYLHREAAITTVVARKLGCLPHRKPCDAVSSKVSGWSLNVSARQATFVAAKTVG